MNLPPVDLSKIPKKQLAMLAGGVVFVLILIAVILVNRKNVDVSGEPAFEGSLSVWGVINEDRIRPFIDSFTSQNSKVQVAYKYVDPDKYEAELLNALASGN